MKAREGHDVSKNSNETGVSDEQRSDLNQIFDDPRFSAFPPDIQERLKRLSPEAAAAVIASGLIFWIVPGPGTPLILAGGLRLWPEFFQKFSHGLKRYFPKGHSASLEVLRRFLDDLENRFPQSS
ncbi:MAG: hypothetical protein RJA81_135 [Planctomycetota bacterium]|jgi:hypothetical protein